MAKRTTRNKIRFQVKSAEADLKTAQIHLTQALALANDRHPVLNDHMPPIIAALELVIKSVDRMYDQL